MEMTHVRVTVLAGIVGAAFAACTDGSARESEPARAAVPGVYSRPIPDIGARVRVIAPSLGPGWRIGTFNRTRQEPPCYIVLIADPVQRSRDAATLPSRALVRLQVSTLYGTTGSKRDPDPGASAYDGEQWLDVRVDSMQRVGQQCADSIARAHD